MESYIEHFGYLAVLIGTFLEGETIVVLAGFAAHRGYLNLPLVICAAFIGSLVGDQLFYYLGRKHFQAVLARRPAWGPRIEKAKKLASRHQIGIILGFRFLYGLRTVIPFTLGTLEVRERIFIPLNIVGALVWSVAIGFTGYFFGQTLEGLFGHLKHVEFQLMGLILLAGMALWVFRRWRSRRRDQDPSH